MKNLELLLALKKRLPAERFIIGGSNAIKLHGIKLIKEPGDLDIILEKPLPHAINNLEIYQNQAPNPKFTGNASMGYSFLMDDVKVDVWIKKELSIHPLMSYEGILVNSMADIVEAKMKFNRSKDWVQLMQWSKCIFNKNLFESSLDEIGASEDYAEQQEDAKKDVEVYKDVVSDPWDKDMEDDLPI